MRFYTLILCGLLFFDLTTQAQTTTYDINAQLYINRAGIQSATEKDAINKFVRALKYYNIWDNIHALYIPTGGTEQSHKLNLKDPRDADDAFRLFYPNGAEHSNSGTAWNGENQGAFSFYSPTSTRLHLMIYQDEPSNQPYIFSGDQNGVTDYNAYTWSALFTDGYIGFANQGDYNADTTSQPTGFFYGQRFDNDSTEGYLNGSLAAKWFQPFSAGYNTDTTQKIWINKSSGELDFSDTARYQVMSIGNVMDSSSVMEYYEIVQAFLTELGIQVGTALSWPIVPDNFISDYTSGLRWVKATENAVDTAIDGAHLFFLNDSLYLWGGWNGNWFPYDFNTGYVSGDGGYNWNRIGQAPWNIRHSAAYGTDQNNNGYLVGSDLMPTTTGTDRKEVWKTIDGRNWELKTNNAPWSENLVLHGLAIKGDTLYIGGGQFGASVSSGTNDTIWRSTDGGINWTAINTNANHLGGILYNNFKYFSARNKFVAFCGGIYDNDPSLRIFSNQIWTSDDCITWTREKDVPFAPRQYSNTIEWDGKLWVWAGDRPAQSGSGTLNLKDLWYMDKDGQWHEVGNVPVPGRHATALAVDKTNDHLVFACGNLHSDVWYLEKTPLHNDQEVFIDSTCSLVVPNYIDSLQNDFGSQVSFTQAPSAGTIFNFTPGQIYPATVIADFGNGITQTTNFYLIPKDTIKPKFTCPLNRTIYLGDSCSFVVPDVISGLTISDCNSFTVHQFPEAGTIISSSDGQISPVTITAQDTIGNISSCSVLITLKDTTSPVFDPIQSISVNNDTGKCETNIAIPIPIAHDNCTNVVITGLRSDSLSLNKPYPVGTTVITWKASDNNGNSAIYTQSIEVSDTELPVLNIVNQISFCPTASKMYTVPKLKATDNCGVNNIHYSITGATERLGNGTDASGIFNEGVSIIVWTVKDIHDNENSFQTTVTISKRLEADIPDVYVLPRGASANTLYFGYGPPSLQLTVNAKDGVPPYNYSWSDGQRTSTIQINNVPGTYDYGVLVTDALGCLTYEVKQIKILNVRCGSNLDKVSVCKFENGQLSTVCVDPLDVSWYLERQSYLGICADNISNVRNTIPNIVVNNKLQVAIMPNPASQFFNIKLESLESQPITVKLMDAIGNKLDVIQNISPGTILQIGNRYLPGVYFIEIYQGKEKLVYKLIKTGN